MSLSRDNAFLLLPFDIDQAKLAGASVVKFYDGTLSSGAVDITTDFALVKDVFLVYTGSSAPADSLIWAAAAGVVTVKGTGNNTFRAMVVGVLAAQS